MTTKTDLEYNKFKLQDQKVILDTTEVLPWIGQDFNININDLERDKFIPGTTHIRIVKSI